MLTEKRYNLRPHRIGPSTIPGAGLGVFARTPIRRASVLGIYRGSVVTPRSLCCVKRGKLLYLKKGVWLDGTGLWSTMNGHPDKRWQNTRFVYEVEWGLPKIEATRDIASGEELIADYGPIFWCNAFEPRNPKQRFRHA